MKCRTSPSHFVLLLILMCAPMSYAQETDQQESRIDFGNAYIQGQSIKSGAVYLTNRRKSKLKSLLKDRENYRFEILNSYYNGNYEEAGSADETTDSGTTPVNE
ncbi:hypothetical protein P886_1315 [Alteromonadaceae bacterium 2753L.S.0a.02]|nr:hypothetical protein P886_1315 [Alteromonadaceae bacterium 2753L.S.0a.02]